MDLLETILKRRSVRAYLDKPIEEDKIVKIMGAGLHSASAMNHQPYKVYVVQDKLLRGKIVDANFRLNFWMKEAPLIIVVAVKTTGQNAWDTLRDHYLDAGIMIENMMLAATALGLGSCACAAYNENKLREALSIPKNLKPVLCLPVGYPRQNKKGLIDLPKSYEKITRTMLHYKARKINDIFIKK